MRKIRNRQPFQYDGGIASFVTYYNQNKEVLHPKPIYIEGVQSDVVVEIAFQFNTGYSEEHQFLMRIISEPQEGGFHESGIQKRTYACLQKLRQC